MSQTADHLHTDPEIDDVPELELDTRIVETGPAASALLCSTDDGCDTRKGSDC